MKPRLFEGPGPPFNFRHLLVVGSLFAFLPILAEKSSVFHVRSLCKSHFLQGIYRQTDGGQLISQNNKNLDCVMTFQTHTVLQRFMVRFDRLHLDCNDHLYVYDGGNAVGSYKANLSCQNTTEGFGIMFTGTNFLTLKYITDAWGTDENGFELIMTAFKDQTVHQICNDFNCNFRNACISRDLVCDNLNHCMDASDEAVPYPCRGDLHRKAILASLTYWVPKVLLTLMAFGMLLIIMLVCIRTRQSSRHQTSSSLHNSTMNFQMENMHGANGTSVGLIPGTTIISNDKCSPKTIPGNWHHPAVLKLGYSEVRVRLYCQAK